MAGATSPPHGATRFIETTRGVLSYAELSLLLAADAAQWEPLRQFWLRHLETAFNDPFAV